MTDRENAPRSFIAPAALTLAAGVLSLHGTWTMHPVHLSWPFALLIGAGLLSENYAVDLRGFSVSLAFPLVMTSLVLYGPASAPLVAATCFTNMSEIQARRPMIVLVYNLGQFLLWSSSAAWTYTILGGPVLSVGNGVPVPLVASAVPVTLLALLSASLVGSLVNMMLAALGLSILKGLPLERLLRSVLTYLPTQMILALVGLLMAQVMAVKPIALLAFLVPLFLARRVYQSYEDMQTAYVDTMRSLIGALEARDAYTGGHSERVANYALCVGRRLSMKEQELRTLQRAALLHDLGKLAVSLQLLSKESGLTKAEREVIEAHPSAGSQMVARIPAIRDLASCVRSHHERFDGTGYPDRLSGRDIPLLARVLAVADSYDAMTTDRSYRAAMTHAEAVAELSKGQLGQFDPDVVQAFIASGAHADQIVSAERTAFPAPAGVIA